MCHCSHLITWGRRHGEPLVPQPITPAICLGCWCWLIIPGITWAFPRCGNFDAPQICGFPNPTLRTKVAATPTVYLFNHESCRSRSKLINDFLCQMRLTLKGFHGDLRVSMFGKQPIVPISIVDQAEQRRAQASLPACLVNLKCLEHRTSSVPYYPLVDVYPCSMFAYHMY